MLYSLLLTDHSTTADCLTLSSVLYYLVCYLRIAQTHNGHSLVITQLN